MIGKLSYKDIKDFLENEENKKTARAVFGTNQPSIHQTGYYTPSSANWSYQVGIVKTEDGRVWEVVQLFGRIEAAQEIYL